jgi:phosphoglycerol transferase MdoB-like AlkP superfamily enzyme
MNPYTQNKNHQMFRLSLLGFVMTVASSPFVILAFDSYLYGRERDLLLFSYPAFGTFLSAFFLALSFQRSHQRIKVIAIPCVAFGLLAAAVMNPWGNYELPALWSLLISTAWLSGILRQRAYQEGHHTSSVALLVHQGLAVVLGLLCLWSCDLAVLAGAAYWFGAVAAYLYLFVESGVGPEVPVSHRAGGPGLPFLSKI